MNEPVLVLNANFEPIHVCSTRRAVTLILAGKAGMIANGRGHIRTISQLIPRPSVIRLETQIHRPRPRVKLTRRELFRRDNYTCQYCGKRERQPDGRSCHSTPYGRQAYLDESSNGLLHL
jgi:5-methylcytosine-specific restriction endonuclease McrA